MSKGYLSEYFEGVGVKTLSKVDAEPASSNQHEIGTTKPMKKFLGTEKTRFRVKYLWLNEDGESISEAGEATYYDSRKGKPRSAEYRLYYPSNEVTRCMSAGDTLFLAIRPDKTIFFIVTPMESTIQNQLLWLFGIEDRPGIQFASHEIKQHENYKLDFTSRFILDQLGIEFEEPVPDQLEKILKPFGQIFPSTTEFSSLARNVMININPLDDPDEALMAWLDKEESMFRYLERKIISERITQGFGDSDGKVHVDAFISFSLGVQNRRARMGRSFEHHLKAIFDAHKLKFDTQVITEKGKKPDFIFPGSREYEDPEFNVNLLTMLAAKTTCKDRWTQILPEAERIKDKHLVTLEPAISVAQTDRMKEFKVQLIVPYKLQSSYTENQKEWLWNLRDFIGLVAGRQTKT